MTAEDINMAAEKFARSMTAADAEAALSNVRPYLEGLNSECHFTWGLTVRNFVRHCGRGGREELDEVWPEILLRAAELRLQPGFAPATQEDLPTWPAESDLVVKSAWVSHYYNEFYEERGISCSRVFQFFEGGWFLEGLRKIAADDSEDVELLQRGTYLQGDNYFAITTNEFHGEKLWLGGTPQFIILEPDLRSFVYADYRYSLAIDWRLLE